MRNFRLSIITENQNQLRKADKVAALVKSELNLQSDPVIRKYEKTEDSYKITFSGKIDRDTNHIAGAIEMADRLASPWITSYDRTTGGIELIFNRSSTCRYGRKEFNVVCWAILEIE